MLRTIVKPIIQGANEAYAEAEIRFPQRSKVTILRADIIVESFIIVDTARLQLCIAKGQIAAMLTPVDNQCVWYKDYLQVGAQAGAVDLSWLVQNLPNFTTDYITLALDTANTGLTNTAYFTLLVDVKKGV